MPMLMQMSMAMLMAMLMEMLGARVRWIIRSDAESQQHLLDRERSAPQDFIHDAA